MREKLVEFVREILQVALEGGGLDGGEIQDMAVEHGLLVETKVSEPCGEYCRCDNYGAEFPTICYRYAEALKKTTEERR